MRLAIKTLCVVVLFGLLSARAEKSEAPIEPKEEPIKLFNGKDLGGWYTWLQDTKYDDPRGVFTVRDGVLHISGDGLGGVVSKAEYTNFHLVSEFKWGPRTWANRKASARDSGVLVHCTGRDGGYNGIWMASVEAQIIEGGVGDILVVPGAGADGKPVDVRASAEVTKDRDGETVWKAGGEKKEFTSGRINWWGRDVDWADKIDFRGEKDVESTFGKWTRMDVICAGDKMEIYVNGVKVNEASAIKPTAGRITIQSELAELLVRRFDLYPVGKAPAMQSAEELNRR